MTARHTVADVLLFSGVALILVACLGVTVMRSAYDRLHFTSPAVLGALLVAIAVVVQDSFSLIGDKALLIGILLVVASPLLTQATARVARIRQHGDWRLRPEEEDDLEVEDR